MSTTTITPGVPFEIGRYSADEGTIGGDSQLSAAPGRRFGIQHDDGTYTVLEEAAYVVPGARGEFVPRRDGYAVENMTGIVRCTDLDDIGGSEITSGYEYQIVNYTTIGRKADALSVARQYIRNLTVPTAAEFDYHHSPVEVTHVEPVLV